MRQRGNNQGRNRRLCNATGIPGWVRFGRSSGFAGGGRGLGPCAEYLKKTGQMDEFVKDMTENNPNNQEWQKVTSNWNFQAKSEDGVLKDRIHMLEDELKELKKQLKSRR